MISDIIALFVTICFILAFSRIKYRKHRMNAIRNKIKEVTGVEYEIVGFKKPRNILFPWWFRIIAFLLSFTCMAFCIDFIYIKGW
jgi:hypothetical protein